MREMGVEIEEGDDYIHVAAGKDLIATNVKTLPHPGFPTDLQPQMTVLLSTAMGKSTMLESVFENRFQYIEQLNHMGTKINVVNGNKAEIEGVSHLKGSNLIATDLRAGACMILAGLKADGETYIDDIKYIDRGYESVEDKLRALGADVSRV